MAPDRSTTSSNLAPGQVAGSLEPIPGQPEPMWHPRFLQHLNEVTNYGAIRFMGWEKINQANWDRDTLEWSDRADPSYCFNSFSTIDSSYNRYPLAAYRQELGLPFEWMIDLCNAAGKDLWIQVPHIASPDLIRKLADLCAARLNSNLRVWFEFSNEIWNYSGGYVPQGNLARMAAAVHYGIPLSAVDTIGSQHAWGSGHIQGLALKTFEDEWRADGQPDSRLINVVSSFVANSSFSAQVLAAVKEIDPNLPEVLAVTDYFGYGTQYDIFALHDFGTNAGVWPDSLFDGTAAIVRRNLYATADTWKASAAVAHAAGVPLVAYEGGQHMLAVGLGDWNNPADADFMNFLYAFQRSPQIHDLYLEHYALWNAMGGRTASLFTDVGTMSFWGYWGAKEYVTQTRTNCAKWDAFGTWADLETGVRAMSDPLGTRPVLQTPTSLAKPGCRSARISLPPMVTVPCRFRLWAVRCRRASHSPRSARAPAVFLAPRPPTESIALCCGPWTPTRIPTSMPTPSPWIPKACPATPWSCSVDKTRRPPFRTTAGSGAMIRPVRTLKSPMCPTW